MLVCYKNPKFTLTTPEIQLEVLLLSEEGTKIVRGHLQCAHVENDPPPPSVRKNV